MDNKEESKKIRELFKADKSLSAYKLVENGHGKGTAYGWIHVTVTYPDGFYPVDDSHLCNERYHERSRIYYLIKNAVDRGDRHDDVQSDYFCENILLTFQSASEWSERNSWKTRRKERRIKNQTCPSCGTVTKEFRREGYHFIRCCRKCETQWTHGSA